MNDSEIESVNSKYYTNINYLFLYNDSRFRVEDVIP